MRCSNCWMYAAFGCQAAYWGPENETLITRMSSGLKPGGRAFMRQKLFNIRPAPVRSTIARASSAATRSPRIRSRLTTGPNPNRMPAASETARVKLKTEASMVASPNRGAACGAIRIITAIAHLARSRPAAPPKSASTTLSVRSCRSIRRRPAPSATRIAISRRLVDARASSRLAMLAQAISNTKPALTSSTINPRRASPTSFSFKGAKCSLTCLR